MAKCIVDPNCFLESALDDVVEYGKQFGKEEKGKKKLQRLSHLHQFPFHVSRRNLGPNPTAFVTDAIEDESIRCENNTVLVLFAGEKPILVCFNEKLGTWMIFDPVFSSPFPRSAMIFFDSASVLEGYISHEASQTEFKQQGFFITLDQEKYNRQSPPVVLPKISIQLVITLLAILAILLPFSFRASLVLLALWITFGFFFRCVSVVVNQETFSIDYLHSFGIGPELITTARHWWYFSFSSKNAQIAAVLLIAAIFFFKKVVIFALTFALFNVLRSYLANSLSKTSFVISTSHSDS